MIRAAKSVGAQRVRRDGRIWVLASVVLAARQRGAKSLKQNIHAPHDAPAAFLGSICGASCERRPAAPALRYFVLDRLLVLQAVMAGETAQPAAIRPVC